MSSRNLPRAGKRVTAPTPNCLSADPRPFKHLRTAFEPILPLSPLPLPLPLPLSPLLPAAAKTPSCHRSVHAVTPLPPSSLRPSTSPPPSLSPSSSPPSHSSAASLSLATPLGGISYVPHALLLRTRPSSDHHPSSLLSSLTSSPLPPIVSLPSSNHSSSHSSTSHNPSSSHPTISRARARGICFDSPSLPTPCSLSSASPARCDSPREPLPLCLLMDLPDVLLERVLGFLEDPRDVRAALLVHSRWHALLAQATLRALPDCVEEVVGTNEQRHHERLFKGPLLGHQSHLSASMRRILFDWLFEVSDEFHCAYETTFLSMHFIDAYLASSAPVPLASLQLLGVTSLWIASKYEEVLLRPLNHFVLLCDGLYSRQQISEMELALLSHLQFDLAVLTRFHVLQLLFPAALLASHRRLVHLSTYLCFLSQFDESLSQQPPSLIAAAAFFLAAAYFSAGPQPTVPLPTVARRVASLFPFSGPSDVLHVAGQLLAQFLHPHEFLQTSFMRNVFSQPRKARVASLDLHDRHLQILSSTLHDLEHSSLLSPVIEHEELSDSDA